MAKCDVNTLLARAKCFQCLDPGTLSVLQTQLICNWLQGLNPDSAIGQFYPVGKRGLYSFGNWHGKDSIGMIYG